MKFYLVANHLFGKLFFSFQVSVGESKSFMMMPVDVKKSVSKDDAFISPW